MNSIDFHAHILPGVDHGSNSVEISDFQLKLAAESMIDTVIATSHFYPHKEKADTFLERRNSAFEKIRSNNHGVNVILGAEILLCENLDRMPQLKELTIGVSDVLLIELPFSGFRAEYAETLESIMNIGFTVVLAHADRYNKNDIELLISMGAKIQLNASSLSKLFVKKHLKEWIERGIVVAIGSDIHMMDKNAYKNYETARKKLGADFQKIMIQSQKLLTAKKQEQKV